MTASDYKRMTAWLEERLRKTSAKSAKHRAILRDLQYAEYRLFLLVHRRKQISQAVSKALAAQASR